MHKGIHLINSHWSSSNFVPANIYYPLYLRHSLKLNELAGMFLVHELHLDAGTRHSIHPIATQENRKMAESTKVKAAIEKVRNEIQTITDTKEWV